MTDATKQLTREQFAAETTEQTTARIVAERFGNASETVRKPPQAATPNFLTIASDLVQRGFKVTPLEGKRPILPDWPKTASNDPAVIAKWAVQYPNHNAGIVTSENSWAVDVDHTDWFMGNAPRPPKTLIVRTGSGKYHFHFKGPRPEGLKMVKNPAFVSKEETPKEPVKLLEYPDQVVAPGSIHPDTGKPYSIWQDEPLIECPAAWLQWLHSLNDKKQLSKSTAKLVIRADWNPEAELEKAGLKFTKRLEDGTDYLEYHAAMGKCLIKDGPHHTNGQQDGQRQSRFLVKQLENGWVLAHQCFSCGGGNTKQALAALGIDIKDIIETQRAYRVEITTHRAGTAKAEPLEWLVKGYLPKGTEVYLFASKGRGKTKVCNYFNKLVNDQGLRVIRFNMEDHEASIFKPTAYAAGCNLDDLTEVVDRSALAIKDGRQMQTSIDFSQPECIEALERLIVKFNDVGLVIIEPINNYKGRSKAVSEDDMRPIHTALATLAEKLKICILVVSHTNKKKDVDIQDKAHGATSGINVARVNLYLDKDPDGDPDVRILADAGSNVKVGKSMQFRIVEQPPFVLDGATHDEIAIAVFEGETEVTARHAE